MTRRPRTPPVYLVMDQGGHASRALLFDQRGQRIGASHVGVETHRPQPGWVEHDAAAVLNSVRQAVAMAWEEAGRPPVISAGLATQRSTIVCWDHRSGLPLSPAISWQDTRGHATVQRLQAHGSDIRRHTGLVLSAHYGASKLGWCIRHLAPVRRALSERRLAWGPLASFLLHGLLEEHPLVVDPANASRTLLWDLTSRDWGAQLLDWFGIAPEALPACVSTEHAYGHLCLGSQRVPLVVCTGDQSAVPFATGRPDRETVYINLGTGAFMQRVIGHEPVMTPQLLTSVLWGGQREGLYVLEGTVNGAGSAIDQISGELGWDSQSALDNLPGDTTSGIPLFLNGVSGLGSPFWRGRFESRFIGDATPHQRMQAVLESIQFLLKVNANLLSRVSGPLQRVVVTGGLSASQRLCQGLADLMGVPVQRPVDIEATARGVACLVAGCPVWSHAAEGYTLFERADNPPLRSRYDLWRCAMDEALVQTGRDPADG